MLSTDGVLPKLWPNDPAKIMGARSRNVSDPMLSMVQNASFFAICFLLATRLVHVMLVVPQTIEFWFELAAVETNIGAIGHTLDDIGWTLKELF